MSKTMKEYRQNRAYKDRENATARRRYADSPENQKARAAISYHLDKAENALRNDNLDGCTLIRHICAITRLKIEIINRELEDAAALINVCELLSKKFGLPADYESEEAEYYE